MCNPRKLKPGKLYFAALDFSVPKLNWDEKTNTYQRNTFRYPRGTAMLYVGQCQGCVNLHEFLVDDKTVTLRNPVIREFLVTAKFWQNLTQAFCE